MTGGMAEPEGWWRRPCAGRRSRGQAQGRRQQIADRRSDMLPGLWSRVAQIHICQYMGDAQMQVIYHVIA